MAERLTTDDELRQTYTRARSRLTAPGAHVPEDVWVGLADGSIPPHARAEHFDHIVRCADCARVWRALDSLRHDAETEGLLTGGPTGAGVAWLSSPAVRYAVAATLVMSVAAAFWLGGRFAAPPDADVVRSGSGAAGAMAITAVLDMEPDAGAVARRAVTLLTCPAPPLSAAERLQASLTGPSSQVMWTDDDVDPVSGRVRVVADLTDSESGTWTLRLVRVDAAGREQGATGCRFELR